MNTVIWIILKIALPRRSVKYGIIYWNVLCLNSYLPNCTLHFILPKYDFKFHTLHFILPKYDFKFHTFIPSYYQNVILSLIPSYLHTFIPSYIHILPTAKNRVILLLYTRVYAHIYIFNLIKIGYSIFELNYIL